MKNQLKFGPEEEGLDPGSVVHPFWIKDGDKTHISGEFESRSVGSEFCLGPILELDVDFPVGEEAQRDSLREALVVCIQKWYAEEYNPDPFDLARRLLRSHQAFSHPLCSISCMDLGMGHLSISAHSERWSVQRSYEGSRLELEIHKECAYLLGIQIDERLRGVGLGQQLYFHAERIAKAAGAKRIEMTASGTSPSGETRAEWCVRKLGYTHKSGADLDSSFRFLVVEKTLRV